MITNDPLQPRHYRQELVPRNRRLYQSGQFVNMVSEPTDIRWIEAARETLRNHLLDRSPEVDAAPGILFISDVASRIAAAYEWTSRLMYAKLIDPPIHITIELHNAYGYLLTADSNRSWRKISRVPDTIFGKSWVYGDELMGDVRGNARSSILWFFERMDWIPTSGVMNQMMSELFPP